MSRELTPSLVLVPLSRAGVRCWAIQLAHECSSMAFTRDFRELEVWRRAHALTLAIYRTTSAFPDGERFGLTSQLRRSAASIPTNVAEGKARSGSKPFAAFVDVAAGSAAEVDYLLLLAHDLGYLPREQLASLGDEIDQIRRMLSGLRVRLRATATE